MARRMSFSDSWEYEYAKLKVEELTKDINSMNEQVSKMTVKRDNFAGKAQSLRNKYGL